MNLVFIESNTTGTGMLALERARELGFQPVLATAEPARYAGLDATGVRIVLCDTNDTALLPGLLESTLDRIAGVTTTSEFYVVTAARVAAALGLPGNPPDAVAICRDKGLMRRTLAADRLPSPAFALVTADRDLEAQIAEALALIELPCVVKPVDDTGSFSVGLCSTSAEVLAHCRAIVSTTTNVRGQATARTALIEGYLNGPEFSLEMISSSGTHHCVGITAKRVTPPPYFVERGHVFPAPLPETTAATLTGAARRALTAVGITHGVTHLEMKLIHGMGYVVEINARPAGGMIPEVIALSCGFDLVAAHLRAATGLPPPPPPTRFIPAGIAFLLASQELRPLPGATLREVTGVSQAEAVPGVAAVTITAAAGAPVRPPTCSYDRLGYVIASGSGYAELAEALDTALGHLEPALISAASPIGDR
ncbi:ATP-grasp domain-containing protein [Nonomuraea recticatena]|uniref:ATP-grasp domain-containing protein n=1 Tax=Nonomuraea recticatena TaxID=46178 RepID=A0ABN3T9K9_9ACTN